VTLSYSILRNSDRGGLVGSSESDRSNGFITYHHNLYENLDSRTPLLRGGVAHIYNNYYVDLHESGINSRAGARARVDNNYFEDAKDVLGTFYTSEAGFWQAEQAAVAQTLRDFPLPAREPMIAITKATQQATAELGSLRDLLTNGTRLLSQSAKQMMRLPKAQNDDGESIVLEDEKPKRDNLVDQLFDSTGADEPDGPLVADLNALWNKSKHGTIPGPLDPHGDRQYDDFPAEVVAVRGLTPVPVAIPEPESAALLLLGLIGMGMRRGRER
jgi:hypothetical protein